MFERYPEDEELETIRKWDASDLRGLMDYVSKLWTYPEHIEHEGNTYRLHTLGWSGNEEIIGAVQDNAVWWLMWWHSSERGGHYEFKSIREG